MLTGVHDKAERLSLSASHYPTTPRFGEEGAGTIIAFFSRARPVLAFKKIFSP